MFAWFKEKLMPSKKLPYVAPLPPLVEAEEKPPEPARADGEHVLAFPAHLLEALGGFEQERVVADQARINLYLEHALREAKYVPRAEAEADPAWKQVIPYAVLIRRPSAPCYFSYRRTSKGGESRLHERWSLGVGGHVNPCDGEPATAYERAFWRELGEEVGIGGPRPEAPVRALLYDPSDEVGRVHFGLVHFLMVPEKTPLTFLDPSLAEGHWRTPLSLRQDFDLFEGWSKLVIKSLILP